MQKIVSDLERRAIIADNIDGLMNTCGLRVGKASVKLGICREMIWRHRTGRNVPSLSDLGVYASWYRLHVVELVLSRDELLSVLLDLIGCKGIRVPEDGGSTDIPYFDYARVISFRLLMERRRTGLKLKELEAKLKKVVSYSALNRYESGKDPFPTRFIVPVASVFGATPLEFLTPPEHLPDVTGSLARKYRVLDEIGEGII